MKYIDNEWEWGNEFEMLGNSDGSTKEYPKMKITASKKGSSYWTIIITEKLGVTGRLYDRIFQLDIAGQNKLKSAIQNLSRWPDEK